MLLRPGTLKCCALQLQRQRRAKEREKLAEAAAKHGLLVMLVCHRITTEAGWGAKWSTKEWPLARVKSSWDRMARVLCPQWNVFAMDVKNEPHDATWGTVNTATDWDLAVPRIADAVRKDRAYAVDAAIVRVMKARRTLPQKRLV